MKKTIDFSVALGVPPLPSHSSDMISALLWAREVLQQHLTTTYSVKNPLGIEELKSVKIGGVDQWLHIRGRNRNNPVLLCLHGGPGFPNIGFMDAIQRPWEDYFTVVQWDQRQTGKSYNPTDNSPLTVQQFVEDTEEVLQYLRDYLEKEKLFVLGASWGSVLGMHMVKRRPEWLHAYISTGQVVNSVESERLMHDRLLGHAKAQKNDNLIAQLEAIAPYPNPDFLERSYLDNALFIRRELSRLAGEALMHHLFVDDVLKIVNLDRSISPHLTLADIGHAVLGNNEETFNAFSKETLKSNLPAQLGSSFNTPIFFFTGSHDYHTSRLLSDQWFSEIDAPYKELIHFEESCHVVINEEPGKFLMALVNKVLPFAQSETSRDVNDA